MKWTAVGAFTPQKSAKATRQGFSPVDPLLKVDQHTVGVVHEGPHAL